MTADGVELEALEALEACAVALERKGGLLARL